MLIREQLSEVYQQQEEWSKAAQALAGIDLDSGMRVSRQRVATAKLVFLKLLYLWGGLWHMGSWVPCLLQTRAESTTCGQLSVGKPTQSWLSCQLRQWPV